MSKLHKSIHKLEQQQDFNSILTSKLNQLSINVSESRSPSTSSIKSPLSRQESRQNSILSVIIDPQGDDDESDSRNDSLSGKEEQNLNKLKIYTTHDLINILTKSTTRAGTRNRIGTAEREILLGQLYKMIVSVKNEVYFEGLGPNEEDFIDLISFKPSDGFEFDAWIRCITSYGCVGVDDVASIVVDELFNKLLRIVMDTENDKYGRSECLWSFNSLLLFIFFGSAGHGLEKNIELFLDIVENVNEDNIEVIKSSLMGIGIVLTLCYENCSQKRIRQIVEELLPKLTWILEDKTKDREISSAVAIVIGVCYEVYNKGQGDEDDDDDESEDIYYDEDLLKKTLEELSQESIKKVGKRGKDPKNIFKDVLRTIEGQKLDEIDKIALSKTKNIDINSWFSIVRMNALKFIYGSEFSLWYVKSKLVRRMLRKPDLDGKGEEDELSEDEATNDAGKGWMQKERVMTGIKKEQQIRHARDEKMEQLDKHLDI